MKKREFWELIEKQGGSCDNVDCSDCRVNGKANIDQMACDCPTKRKVANGGQKAYNDTAVEAARLADAQSWLARHPKKDKTCPDCANYKPATEDKPFVPATEFMPGKFYRGETGQVVMCDDAKSSPDTFSGVVVIAGISPVGNHANMWLKECYSGPVEVEIKVVDR